MRWKPLGRTWVRKRRMNSPISSVMVEGLLEGEPQRAGVTLAHAGRPQHHHIDALVGDAVTAQQPRDPAGGVLGIPRLEPRADALLKISTNLVGDAAVNV